VSSEEKAELARRAGAELVVNYRTEGYDEEIRAFSPTYDRIIEVALGPNLDLDLSVSGPQTTIVAYASDQEDPVLPVRRCMTANVALRFVLLYGVPKPALARAVADVNEAVAGGALTPLPVRRFPLEAIADAHDAVEARALGKVLVDLP
jgi:NADPH2:quinone reductase